MQHKAYTTRNTLSVFVLCLGLFLGGCQKSSLETPSKVTLSLVQQALRGLTTEKGYLVFKDTAHYQSVLEQISKMDETQANEFSGSLNIVSKRHKMNEALHAYAILSESERLKDEFKKELRFDAEGNYSGFAFPLYNRAAILNEMGMVKVGKEIYVFTNDKFIALRDGDINKLKTLPTTGDETVNESNFFISKLHRESKPQVNPTSLEIRSNGTFSTDYVLLPRSPYNKYYYLYMDYTWYETSQGPVANTTFKNFEFNIHGAACVVIRNRPFYNSFEQYLGVNNFTASCTIYSNAERVTNLTKNFVGQAAMRSSSWFLDKTVLSGVMLSDRGYFTGMCSWQGGVEASSENGTIFTFNRTERFLK